MWRASWFVIRVANRSSELSCSCKRSAEQFMKYQHSCIKAVLNNRPQRQRSGIGAEDQSDWQGKTVVYTKCAIIICPIAIAYSMGQIIKSVCVCQCVSLSVRLRALSRSHFLIDFHKNWHRRKYPKRKKEFVRGSISHHPFPYFAPENPHFMLKGPENPCKY